MKQMANQQKQETGNELKEWLRRVRELSDRLNHIHTEKVGGILSVKLWKQEHDQLKMELNEVYEEIRGYQEGSMEHYGFFAQVFEFTQCAEKLFLEGDVAIKKKILELLCLNLRLQEGKTLMDTKNPSLISRRV